MNIIGRDIAEDNATKHLIHKFYMDAGHGWCAVKIKTLVELNILNKITPYSYVRGNTAYLEEDCDFTTFVQAYVSKYGIKPLFEIRNTDKRSPIRSYERYDIAQMIVYVNENFKRN